MVIPEDIAKYALGLFGPKSVTQYIASPFAAGALAQLKNNQIISYEYENLLTPNINQKKTLPSTNQIISYQYDSYGFRKPESVIGKRVAFGCSHTFGYEVAVENSYPFLLSATNFGVTAASPQTVARLVKNWIPNSEVEEVIILMPDSARREVWNPNTATYTMMGSWCLEQFIRTIYNKHDDAAHDPYWYEKSSDLVRKFSDEHPHLDILDEKKNQEILDECIDVVKRHVGERKLVLKSVADAPPPDFEARDRSHNGETWHRKVAQMFQKEL